MQVWGVEVSEKGEMGQRLDSFYTFTPKNWSFETDI